MPAKYGRDGKQGTPAVLTQSSLPVAFTPNVGQASSGYRFLAQQSGVTVGLLDRAEDIFRVSAAGQAIVRLSFEGADPHTKPIGAQLLAGKMNYLKGNDPTKWQRGIPMFGQVRFPSLYAGIDAIFYGNGRHMENDFIVSPQADPNSIVIRVAGASDTHVSPAGSLVFATTQGPLELRKPVAYQDTPRGRVEVSASYRLDGDRIRFSLGRYDRALPLVIDPVLDYSTYLADNDLVPSSIATDSQGNTYIAGFVFAPTYPTTAGAFQPTCGSCDSTPDVFVTKLNANGSAQVYSTFLGGSNYDQPLGLAVDSNGNAIVVGYTWSKNFPLKNSLNTTDVASNGQQWGFATSLTADGSALNYSTVLGAAPDLNHTETTTAVAVAVDSSGNAYLTGDTNSPLFPLSTGSLQSASGTTYVLKLLPSGAVSYSALIGQDTPQTGGAGPIGPGAIALDSTGNAYVYGKAGTLWPVTTGAYQATVPDGYAAPYVSKLSADGSALIYSTFVGNGYQASGIVVDGNGQANVTGWGSVSGYPVTSDALISTSTASYFSWLTTLNSSGTALVYSSFLSSGRTISTSIARDALGNLWVVGGNADAEFPLLHPVKGVLGLPSQGQFQVTEGFLSEFDSTGKNLLFSSYFGGATQGTNIVALSIDANGKAHIAGSTFEDLYTTPGVFQSAVTPRPQNTTPTPGFAAEIDPSIASAALCHVPTDAQNLTFVTFPAQTSSEQMLVGNCGNAPLVVSSITATDSEFTVPDDQNNCKASVPPAGSCTITVQFAPAVSATPNATIQALLEFNSNASLPVTGVGVSALVMPGFLTLSPASVNFANQDTGTTSSVQTITITEASTQGAVAISSITTTGDFSSSNNCTTPLVLYESCQVMVTFIPTAAGNRVGTLTIVDSAPDSPVSVPLTGVGTTPTVTLGAATGGSTSTTVSSGQTATYNLSIAGSAGFSGTVSLACSGAPTDATYSVNPASVSVSKGSSAAFSVSVTTETDTAQSRMNPGRRALLALSIFSVFGIAVIVTPRKPIRRKKRMGLLAVLPLMLDIWACGGGSSGGTTPPPPTPSKTPAGTYSLTITATSGPVTATQKLTLIVQ